MDPTEQTKNDANMLMDCLYTHLDAKLRYHKSFIQLYIDSDAAYLVVSKAKRRVSGHFLDASDKTSNPTLNVPVHIECALLKHMVFSVAEAETGGSIPYYKISHIHQENARGFRSSSRHNSDQDR